MKDSSRLRKIKVVLVQVMESGKCSGTRTELVCGVFRALVRMICYEYELLDLCTLVASLNRTVFKYVCE